MYVIIDNEVVSGTGALIGVLVAMVVAFLALYLLLSFGFYTMAKRRNIAKPYLAFVPFARWLIGGKIVKKAVLFGKVTEKIGLVVAITIGVTVLFNILNTVLSYSVFFDGLLSGEVIVINAVESASTAEMLFVMPLTELKNMVSPSGVLLGTLPQIYSYETLATNMPKWISVLSNVSFYFNMFISIAHVFVMFAFWSAFYRLYKPNSIFMYTIVSALVPYFFPFFEIAGIFVFIFRNREEINIEEMMRNIYRAQGYTNPYNNPYENNANNQDFDPYGRNSAGNGYAKPNQNDNPFDEFDGKNDNSSDDPFA